MMETAECKDPDCDEMWVGSESLRFAIAHTATTGHETEHIEDVPIDEGEGDGG